MHPILKRVTFMRFSAHNVFVEDFMVKDVKFLTTHSSYKDAKQLLESFMFRSFPLIESQGGMRATCHHILTFVPRLSVQINWQSRVSCWDRCNGVSSFVSLTKRSVRPDAESTSRTWQCASPTRVHRRQSPSHHQHQKLPMILKQSQ